MLIISCNKLKIEDDNELEIDKIHYNNYTYSIQFGETKYFGNKMLQLNLTCDNNMNLELYLTDATLNSLDTGEYKYGKMNHGFKMNMYIGDTEKRAKSGTINVKQDSSFYDIDFFIVTTDEDTLIGRYKSPIFIEDYTNNFIYGDDIYEINEAVSVFINGTDDLNYVYLFTDSLNFDKLHIGFVFYGGGVNYIEEGYYAWGGEFGAAVFENNEQISVENGLLNVEFVEESDNGFGVYDIYFSITSNELIRGEYRGEIPVVSYNKIKSVENILKL